MKKTITLLLSVIFVTTFWSCEDGKSGPETNSLVGTWYMSQRVNAKTFNMEASDISSGTLSSWNYETVLTTNSDQEAVDKYSEGIGSIDITGALEAGFKYMFPHVMAQRGSHSDEWVSVYLSNGNFWSAEMTWPIYGLSIEKGWQGHVADDTTNIWPSGGGRYHSAYLWVMYEDGNYADYMGDVDFDYDGKTLTVNSGSLRSYTWDYGYPHGHNGDGIIWGDDSVSVSGSLTHQVITIPANTPTPIYTFGNDDVSIDQGGWTIDIREDGSWIERYEWEDWSDSLVATWEAEDGLLTVTYDWSGIICMGDSGSYGGGNMDDYSYSIEYTYVIENNELILTHEYDICSDDFMWDCLDWFELEFGLDEGSLDSIIDRVQLTFSQTPASSSKVLASEPALKARKEYIKNLNRILAAKGK